MLRQHSLLLSFVVALFVSVSSVWAKNVTVLMDDKRLAFSNSTSWTGGWQFNDTGLCGSDGGIVNTYTQGDWVRLRFNGTAVYVVFAEYDNAALTNVTIDGVQANVTAQNISLSLTTKDCQTRTLYAANLTNTNHTVTVAYAGTGFGRTVLNEFIFDDGGDTPKADPTATRAAVTISDTGASPTATTATSASSTSDTGCGSHCKTASISGGVGLLISLIILYWFWRCCCGSRTRTVTTVVAARPPSPKPQPIILVAATLEVQQTHIQVQSAQRNPVPSPPAYEQTNYK